MPSRTYLILGQVTRFRSTLRLRMEKGRPPRMVETDTRIEVAAPDGAAVFEFRVPVDQLPVDVDVDDVTAEVYVVLRWGDAQIALGPGGIVDEP